MVVGQRLVAVGEDLLRNLQPPMSRHRKMKFLRKIEMAVNLCAMLDRMSSVHQNLWLNDRHQALGLANCSIPARIIMRISCTRLQK